MSKIAENDFSDEVSKDFQKSNTDFINNWMLVVGSSAMALIIEDHKMKALQIGIFLRMTFQVLSALMLTALLVVFKARTKIKPAKSSCFEHFSNINCKEKKIKLIV